MMGGMRKELVFFLVGILLVGSVSGGSGEGTPNPDVISPQVIILEEYDAPAAYPEGMVFDGLCQVEEPADTNTTV
tara:strand:- start:367 stop:591 length:225 start_codon:yes stop_codon:yes gene_type:complete